MASKTTSKSKDGANTYFVITYRDPKEGKIVECKAKTIADSSLGLSFIAISDFVFTSRNSVVVDPTEEYLQKRLENVKSLHLSIYSIVSIEEVGQQVGLKFVKDKSNLVMLNPNSHPEPSPVR